VKIDNEVVGIAAVVDDITEQKRRVDELERQFRAQPMLPMRSLARYQTKSTSTTSRCS
jgi:hypothetical protein